jgi:diguanylate cyclase (GGDEF)-like protein
METVGSNLLDDASVQGIVLTTRDVSERQALEEQLHYQAFHDSLTALPNRRLLAERVEHALAQRVSSARPAALIFIDLDDYKSVNDSLGHHAGDEVLISVAATLLQCVRPGDTTSRLGGDEFAVLLPAIADRSAALEVADRIIRALEVGIVVDGKEIFVGASIGVAFAGVDEGCARALGFDDLVRNADVAMYTAKSRGKGRVEVYEPGMHSAVLNRLRLKADLQRGLDHNEFLLHYQPIVSLTTGGMTGAEALVRWVSPERGLVPPAEFIPLCEETGLIRRLGRWVLNEALWQAAQWAFAERSLTMNVNLSALQLQQPNLAAEIAAALALAAVPADVLTLEVTESMLIGDVEASIRTLNEVRALGVRVVIDDFGTGYSSLSYLRQLPITGFKIDKEFVDAIASDRNDTLLLATVIELARSLGLETTAEGVESQAQMSALRDLGCDLAQGYLFSRPLGADQFDVKLRALIAAGP